MPALQTQAEALQGAPNPSRLILLFVHFNQDRAQAGVSKGSYRTAQDTRFGTVHVELDEVGWRQRELAHQVV